MKILIPSYEPNEKLVSIIKDIKKISNIPIIVVDDGSGENYKKWFDEVRNLGAEVLVHEVNKGKGEAIKTGLKYLLQIGEQEGVVTADSDGQHKAEDIIRVANTLLESDNDLVLGVRNFDSKNVPFRSSFGNKISKYMFMAMTGEKIVDTQTGLRGYSKSIFELLLNISGNRYDWEFNILLEIKDSQIKYVQIPIETIYENNNEVSHFRPIHDSILIYKPVFKFVVSSILSFLIDFILLLVFKKAFGKLLISVILSRIISSVFNFIVNKKYVFEHKNNENILKSLGKYYFLALIILICNYLSLKLLNEILHINLIIAKIITETILYIFSFVVQKRVVFKNNKKTLNFKKK